MSESAEQDINLLLWLFGFVTTGIGFSYVVDFPVYCLVLIGVGIWLNISLKEGLSGGAIIFYRIYIACLYTFFIGYVVSTVA